MNLKTISAIGYLLQARRKVRNFENYFFSEVKNLNREEYKVIKDRLDVVNTNLLAVQEILTDLLPKEVKKESEEAKEETDKKEGDSNESPHKKKVLKLGHLKRRWGKFFQK